MDLARRIGRGMVRRDAAAGAAFYAAHFPLVFAYFRRRTADASAAEDLTAETFKRVLQGLNRFAPGPDAALSSRVWVYRIASNVYKNHLRGVGRETARMAAWARGWQPVGADRIGVETSVALGDAVAQLPPADRNILGLRYWEDLTAPQIAEVVGCTPREVYTTLERCLRQLRLQLGAKEAEHASAHEA